MEAETDRKTHPPSRRKLEQARRRGEVAFSSQLTSAAACLGGLAGLAFCLPDLVARLGRLARVCFAGGQTGLWSEALDVLFDILARVAGAAAAAGLVTGLLQVGFRLRWQIGRAHV
jgi:flagellar biosynthesis protein FlhB